MHTCMFCHTYNDRCIHVCSVTPTMIDAYMYILSHHLLLLWSWHIIAAREVEGQKASLMRTCNSVIDRDDGYISFLMDGLLGLSGGELIGVEPIISPSSFFNVVPFIEMLALVCVAEVTLAVSLYPLNRSWFIFVS